jgi:hypothetical protein
MRGFDIVVGIKYYSRSCTFFLLFSNFENGNQFGKKSSPLPNSFHWLSQTPKGLPTSRKWIKTVGINFTN